MTAQGAAAKGVMEGTGAEGWTAAIGGGVAVGTGRAAREEQAVWAAEEAGRAGAAA